MIQSHHINDSRGYDPEYLKSEAEPYIENRLNEENLSDIIKWDLCDVGARGIQLRAFIGKSSMMWVGSPSHTIEYDLSNLWVMMDEFLDYYVGHCKGVNYTPDSNPTRFQEEQFAKYGCD